MIDSKVIRDHGRHIVPDDYGAPPILDCENVVFPRVDRVQARMLRRLMPKWVTISHRDIDKLCRPYRLAGHIGFLRDKEWPVVDHDYYELTEDPIPRMAKYTRYEMFAGFTDNLLEQVRRFYVAIDEYGTRAVAAARVGTRMSQLS